MVVYLDHLKDGAFKKLEVGNKKFKDGKGDPIELMGSYQIKWNNYSDLNIGNGLFSYLLININV